MPLTGHNQFFGWVHSFKLNHNNSIFKPDPSVERPFPIIVDEPTISQVLSNWNTADTGLLMSTFVFGLLTCKKKVQQQTFGESLLRKRFLYKRSINILLVAGLFLALQNSAYRLQGYVPNGMPKRRTEEVLKYDYTSQFLAQTPWKYVFSARSRPSTEKN